MRRKTIPLKPHEDRQLKRQYIDWRYPLDQYAQRPRARSRFTALWNEESHRSDTADDLFHYMITKRKNGKWVTFDGDYELLRSPKRPDMSDADWDALEVAYLGLGKGRDQYASNIELRDALASEFTVMTGRHITGDLLYAAVMGMQKHRDNNWPRLKGDLGFGDIAEVA